MSASVVDLVLFVLLFTTVPIYLIVVITVIKYRKKTQFRTVLFKLVLSSAVFDLSHLSVNWIFVKFVHLSWFGLGRLVSIAPRLFAKLGTILWWYTAYGQRLGVLLLVALNRVSVLGYNYEWTPSKTKFAFLIHWIVPLMPALPQFWLQYNYSNDSTGGFIIFWENADWRWYYYDICTVWCIMEALLCAVCYGITFYKMRKHKLLMKQSRSGSRGRSTRNQSTGVSNSVEMKLAIVGFSMTVLTAVCGIFCAKMAAIKDVNEMEKWLPYEDILFNIYSWINAYLLLICSTDLRNHFKATILRKNVNAIVPQG